jgi:hypothetical protein
VSLAAASPQRQPFSLERIAGSALFIVVLLLLNKAGPPGNVLFFAILLGMIAMKPETAFKAFTICFLGLVANQSIVLKTPIWTVARFLIPIACLIRFAAVPLPARQGLLQKPYAIALMAFIGVAGALSVLTGYCVEIALLKLLNFTIAAFAILLAVNVLQARRSDMAEWYVTLIFVTVLLGFATIALGISSNFRGSVAASRGLFNGPFYHSNCLGPMVSLMVVYLVCVYVFGTYRNRWICGPLALGLLYFMYLSRSRTSAISMLVGVVFVVVLSFVLSRRGLIKLTMRVPRRAIIATLVLILAGGFIADMATGGGITREIVSFVNKGGRKEEIDVEQMLSSRTDTIERLWYNFKESPLIGIGFEVAKSEWFRQNATLFNAPIEKGFLPMAVLEETGVIGAFFFVVFLLTFMGSLARALNVPGLAMFLTFLAVNCGEAMFFSLGGHGAFGWLLFVGGVLLGDQCVVRRVAPTPRVPLPAVWPRGLPAPGSA